MEESINEVDYLSMVVHYLVLFENRSLHWINKEFVHVIFLDHWKWHTDVSRKFSKGFHQMGSIRPGVIGGSKPKVINTITKFKKSSTNNVCTGHQLEINSWWDVRWKGAPSVSSINRCERDERKSSLKWMFSFWSRIVRMWNLRNIFTKKILLLSLEQRRQQHHQQILHLDMIQPIGILVSMIKRFMTKIRVLPSLVW